MSDTAQMDAAPLTAGIDEAGRGPLAGPVVAAAVILPEGFSALGALDDSKKLTARRREALAAVIRAEAMVSVALAEPAEIDRLNILHATLAAMARAAAGLMRTPQLILIDGNQLPPGLLCPARALVGGDSSEPAIAAASIIAKTTRDALMAQADTRFPGYGFAGHKGYPSPVHRAALEALGPCPLHRLSYAPVRAAWQKSGFARRMMNRA